MGGDDNPWACSACGTGHDCPWCRACKKFLTAPRSASDPEPVATGGVPAGYRLGAGWKVADPEADSCTHLDNEGAWDCRSDAAYVKSQGACVSHAVEMGALVPVDTARPVPPGPVPVEAHASEPGKWAEDMVTALSAARAEVEQLRRAAKAHEAALPPNGD